MKTLSSVRSAGGQNSEDSTEIQKKIGQTEEAIEKLYGRNGFAKLGRHES